MQLRNRSLALLLLCSVAQTQACSKSNSVQKSSPGGAANSPGTAGAPSPTAPEGSTGKTGKSRVSGAVLASIEAGVSSGTLSAEQALMLKTFAVFGDARLPAAFSRLPDSGAAPVKEVNVLSEAAAKWETLSQATQDTLAPFLVRPSDAGSWLNAQAPVARSNGVGRGGVPPSCRGTLASGWAFVTDPAGHVKVWYDSRIAGDGATALAVKTAFETQIWPTLIGTVGLPAPPSDEKSIGCDGGDGKLDVYVVDMATYGETASDRGETKSAVFGCKGTPSWMMINNALTSPDLEGTVAHEFMHAIQFGYNTAACHDAYGWLIEATANWALDRVYPTLQLEQDYSDCVTTTPQKPLDDASRGSCSRNGSWTRAYGSYLFFQFLSKKFGDTAVKSALDNCVTQTTSLAAVDAAVSGGFNKNFSDYSKVLYNLDPIKSRPDSFTSWDSLPDQPDLNLDTSGDLLGAREASTDLLTVINNLSTKFYRFTFSDPNTRSLLFTNEFFPQRQAGKAIKVIALWKDASGAWQEEDWSDYKFVGLCRDLKNQRTDELVLIFSNGEWSAGGGGELTAPKAPTLKASALGCWQYTGTSTSTDLGATWTGTGIVRNAKLTYQLPPSQVSLTATQPLIPNSLRAGLGLGIFLYGDSYDFTVNYTNGCSYSYPTTPFQIFGPTFGVLFLNPFPTLESADQGLKQVLSLPQGSYVAEANDASRFVTVAKSGTACSPTALIPVGTLLLSNSANAGAYINAPLASAIGTLNGTYSPTSLSTVKWDLTPQSEP